MLRKTQGFHIFIMAAISTIALLLLALTSLITPVHAILAQQDNPTATALQATIFFLQTKQSSSSSGMDATTAAQQATIAALQGQGPNSSQATATAITTPTGNSSSPVEVGKEAVVTADGNEVYVMSSPSRH